MTTTAQKLYDLREQTEFCSGMDLHNFFFSQAGDMSPSGETEIDASEAAFFVFAAMSDMKNRSPISYQEIVEIEPRMALEQFTFVG